MIVRTERKIDAAHHIPNYKGKCANVHGHTWRIIVTVDGGVDKKTGMVVDFVGIKNIIDTYDHQDLNHFLECPTAENLVTLLLERLVKEIELFDILTVRVYESAESYAEDSVVRR